MDLGRGERMKQNRSTGTDRKMTIKYLCPNCNSPGEVTLNDAEIEAGGKDFVCRKCDFANAIEIGPKEKSK